MMSKELMTLAQAAKQNPGIGRRRLMKLTGCTGYACEKFLRQTGVVNDRSRTPASEIPRDAVVVCGAINLAKQTRVLAAKPQGDQAKRQLYSLRKGQGYPLESLSESWGMSVDTLRKHAKRLDCLRYVETSPGDWTPCALHPDTAKDYKKGTR